MFIALYRWKIIAGKEETFREGWRRVTEEIYRKCGSKGSRLHIAEDGTFVGYAQWNSREDWEKMQSSVIFEDVEARMMMRESIETAFPNVLMTVTDDLLQSKVFSNET
jgi:heme-degrading monooxygenase HmoA